MFERFTERARQVVVLAQEEARTLKCNYVGTEHILLGLIREEEGMAARVLQGLDITAERVRAQVVRIDGSGEVEIEGQISFTPRAKKVLELSLRQALGLGHNYVGTEHILLGLVRESEGVATRILLDFDADSEKIRNEVIRVLSRPSGAAVSQPLDSGSQAVVKDATMVAWRLGQSEVAPHHLLLALLRSEVGIVGIVMANLKVNYRQWEKAFESALPKSPASEPQGIRFSTATQQVFRDAKRTADAGGHRVIKLHHLLLAVIETSDEGLALMLRGTSLDPKTVKILVLGEMLNHIRVV